jgi:hypothetical protein
MRKPVHLTFAALALGLVSPALADEADWQQVEKAPAADCRGRRHNRSSCSSRSLHRDSQRFARLHSARRAMRCNKRWCWAAIEAGAGDSKCANQEDVNEATLSYQSGHGTLCRVGNQFRLGRRQPLRWPVALESDAIYHAARRARAERSHGRICQGRQQPPDVVGDDHHPAGPAPC